MKARIKYWVVALVACSILQFVVPAIIAKIREPNIYIPINSENVEEYKEIDFILSSKDAFCKSNISDSAVVLCNSEKKLDSTFDKGYKKYSNYFYSPIVFYMTQKDLTEASSVFLKNTEETTYSVDAYVILNAIYMDKTWEDINVNLYKNKTKESSKVCVVVPYEGNPLHTQVLAAFKETFKRVENLEDCDADAKALAVYNKCEKVFDIVAEMTSCEKSKCYVAPEYVSIVNTDTVFTNQNKGKSLFRYSESSFMPVYFTRSYNMYIDMYVKDVLSGDDKEDANTKGLHKNIEKFLDCTVSSSAFMKKTGLRTSNYSYVPSKAFNNITNLV